MEGLIQSSNLFLEQIEQLSSKEIAQFEDNQDDSLYAKGDFELSRYNLRRNRPVKYFHSNPIMVEGVSYRAEIYPEGWGDGEGTHISFGILRNKLSSLNLDAHDENRIVRKMFHASDRAKDYQVVSIYDFKDS